MNKAEKSLRWVVNQIPDFKPTTNEEKMLVAIKLYSEAGAEEIKRLESENAELHARLDKAIEFPRIRKAANHSRTGKYVVEFIDEEYGSVDLHIDLTKEEAEARLAELKGGAK